jgi:branched-chain amino acid transport system permease protein
MRKAKVGLLIGILLFAFLIPIFFSNPYILHLFIMIYFQAYLGSCWNLLGGYAGQLSFGHAAFFGIGAYTSAWLVSSFDIYPWIGMWIGAFLSMLTGLGLGFVFFKYKVRALFFALGTLAFGEVLLIVARNWFKGGSTGIEIPLKGDSWAYFQFVGKAPYYYIILAMLIGLVLIIYKVEKSKLGYYLLAIRENEESAAAVGVNTSKYKLLAIALSSFFTALGGSYWAQYSLYIEPPMAFRGDLSFDMVVRPLVGGVGTLLGPIYGSLALTPIAEGMNILLGAYKGLHLIIFGLILVVVMMLFPGGLVDLVKKASYFISSRGNSTDTGRKPQRE